MFGFKVVFEETIMFMCIHKDLTTKENNIFQGVLLGCTKWLDIELTFNQVNKSHSND